MRIDRIGFLPVIASLLLSGCTSTQLVGYSDPDYQAPAFRSVAVYANTTDLLWRRALENSAVEAFTAVGVSATATIDVLPPTREYTPEERRSLLRDQGLAALVLIDLEGVGEDQAYIPVMGTMTEESGTVTANATGVSTTTKTETTVDGGYAVSMPWAQIGTRVVDMENGQTVWISSSRSAGNSFASFEDLRQSYSIKLVRELGKKQVVMTTKPLHALDGLNKGPGRLR